MYKPLAFRLFVSSLHVLKVVGVNVEVLEDGFRHITLWYFLPVLIGKLDGHRAAWCNGGARPLVDVILVVPVLDVQAVCLSALEVEL